MNKEKLKLLKKVLDEIEIRNISELYSYNNGKIIHFSQKNIIKKRKKRRLLLFSD